MRWREKYPEEYKRKIRARSKARIAQGLCGKCGQPSVPGLALCEHHLVSSRKRTRKYYQTRGREILLKQKGLYEQRVKCGQCVQCGKPTLAGKILCKRHSDLNRKRQMKHLYGITVEEHKALNNEQKGLCAICKKKAKLDIDHNHETKVVNALLCRRCNTGLGLFGHDPKILMIAADYARKHYTIAPLRSRFKGREPEVRR